MSNLNNINNNNNIQNNHTPKISEPNAKFQNPTLIFTDTLTNRSVSILQSELHKKIDPSNSYFKFLKPLYDVINDPSAPVELKNQVNSIFMDDYSVLFSNDTTTIPELREALESKKRPIHLAAIFGYKDSVKHLATSDTINCRDHQGCTPLYYAAFSGHLETVEMLLKLGADKNIPSHKQRLPSWIANKSHIIKDDAIRKEIVDILDTKKSNKLPDEIKVPTVQENVSIINKQIETETQPKIIPPHHVEIPSRKISLDSLANYLIDIINRKEVDLNSKTNEGKTLLHYATHFALQTEAFGRTVLELLLSKPELDVNVKAPNGMTPLHLAVYKNKLSVVEMLLRHEKIDINIEDNDGYTPLDYTQQPRSGAIAQLLRSKNAQNGTRVSKESKKRKELENSPENRSPKMQKRNQSY